jgi:hypothetical protein
MFNHSVCEEESTSRGIPILLRIQCLGGSARHCVTLLRKGWERFPETDAQTVFDTQ